MTSLNIAWSSVKSVSKKSKKYDRDVNRPGTGRAYKLSVQDADHQDTCDYSKASAAETERL